MEIGQFDQACCNRREKRRVGENVKKEQKYETAHILVKGQEDYRNSMESCETGESLAKVLWTFEKDLGKVTVKDFINLHCQHPTSKTPSKLT